MSKKRLGRAKFENPKNKESQIRTNTDSDSLVDNLGYSNRGGSTDNAVKGAIRGRRDRGTRD